MKIPVKSGERTQRSAHAVGDLIDAVRRHEEAIRSQTTELEQLRAAVLKAAEREAADIIDVARGDIRLIVTDARRRLLELSGSVRLAVSPHADVPARGTEPLQNWQSEARREMLKTLREANAEFGRLADDVTTGPPRDDRWPLTDFPKLVPPLASEESPSDPNESPSTTPYESGDAPDQSQQPRSGLAQIVERPAASPALDISESAPVFGEQPEAERRSVNSLSVLLAAFIGVGVAIVGGTAWWAHNHHQQPSVSQRLIGSTERPMAATTSPVKPEKAPPTRAAAPSPQRGVSLRVEAARPIWIRATIDGRADAGAIQQPGEPREIRGDQEISLRVGDGGAVRVSFNGTEPTVLGRDGEPITRRFALPSATQAASPAPATASSSARGSPDVAGGAVQTINPTGTARSTPAAETAHASDNSVAGSQGSSDNERSRTELQAAAYRWLDAYYEGDSSAAASLGSGGQVSDQRATDERMPRGLSVQRTLEGLTFQFAGETAVLSARMMERADIAGEKHTVRSWLSQTWLRESGKWRLIDVRLLGDARVKAPR